MTNMNRIIISGLIISFFIICLTGCGTTVTGSKTQTSYNLQRSITAPVYWEVKVEGTPKKVFEAALTAASDLSLNVTHQESDQLSGVIKGHFADSTNFGIKMNYDSPGVTKLQITAGNTGDKTLVLQIFKAVEKRL